MPGIPLSTLLRRAPELTVKLESNGNVTIIKGSDEFTGGLHGLAILETFSRPTTFADALGRLKAQSGSAQEWVNLTSAIVMLYDAGVLLDTTKDTPTVSARARTGGFDAAQIHVRMLDDRIRTSRYLDAIAEVVRSGDVVVDIGTGTGVLAIAAARAGARHVYAIEASGIGKVARATFDRNALGERITLVEGWSTQVDLPERADVLVSEIIGNEPLGEQVLETTLDARKRLLKPQARIIPGRLRVYGLGVEVPPEVLAKHTFTDEGITKWKSWYGIDFHACLEAASVSTQVIYVKPHEVMSWKQMTEPALLADIDLDKLDRPIIDRRTVQASVVEDGRLNGMLVYFTLDLGPRTSLSTHPEQAGEACSWRIPVWISSLPAAPGAGDNITMSYEYRGAGAENHPGASALRADRAAPGSASLRPRLRRVRFAPCASLARQSGLGHAHLSLPLRSPLLPARPVLPHVVVVGHGSVDLVGDLLEALSGLIRVLPAEHARVLLDLGHGSRADECGCNARLGYEPPQRKLRTGNAQLLRKCSNAFGGVEALAQVLRLP
jgi:predicted RNA methylase